MMGNTVTVTLELALKPEAVEDFSKQIPEVLKETREFPGYVDIAVHRNADEPNRIILVEEWETRAAYEAYIAFRTETGFMDTLAEILTEPLRLNYWDVRIA